MLITAFSIRTKEVCLTLWKTHLPTPQVPERAFLRCQASCLLTSLPQLWDEYSEARVEVGVNYSGRVTVSELFAGGGGKHSVRKNRDSWNIWVTVLKLPIQNNFIINYHQLNLNARNSYLKQHHSLWADKPHYSVSRKVSSTSVSLQVFWQLCGPFSA